MFLEARTIIGAIIVLSTASVFLLGRRSEAQRSTSQTLITAAARGAGDPTAANAKLEETVKTMLDRDERLRMANLTVHADVTKNEVTLLGTVESEAARARAEHLAKTAQVGVIVNNRISVKPR